MNLIHKMSLAALVFVASLNISSAQESSYTRKAPRQLWAKSYLFADSPKMEFDKWLTDKPDTKNKFIILEFWRTWCSACKKQTPKLNEFQKKFKDDLVVIGVTGQTEEKLASYSGPKKEYFLAIDKAQPETPDGEEFVEEEESEYQGGCGSPDMGCGSDSKVPEQGVTEAAYGVFGWPHVVILEPEERVVVWEGFPLQKGYELTEEKIQKYIDVFKKSQKK